MAYHWFWAFNTLKTGPVSEEGWGSGAAHSAWAHFRRWEPREAENLPPDASVLAAATAGTRTGQRAGTPRLAVAGRQRAD